MREKVRNTILAALFVMAAISTTAVRAAQNPKANEDLNQLKTEAQQAIGSFKAKDPAMQKFFTDSAGYVVFPAIAQGGFVVGGAHGKGLVYQNGKPIGKAAVSKATVGAQVGGQSFAEIIFFQTPATLQDFKESKLEMSAGVSAVVAAEGAAQTASYQHGIAVFTLPKSGLMAQAAVGGQKFKFEPLK